MKATITVRDIDPGDKDWLRHEAKRSGVSMEEYVRRLISEKRRREKARERPSEAFRRHFGAEHGVDLPARPQVGQKPARVAGEGD